MVVAAAFLLGVAGDPDVALLLQRIEALEAKNAALQMRVDALDGAALPASPHVSPPPVVIPQPPQPLLQLPEAAREQWASTYIGVQVENVELHDFLAVSSPSSQFDRANANTQHVGLTVGRRWQVGRLVLGGELSAATQAGESYTELQRNPLPGYWNSNYLYENHHEQAFAVAVRGQAGIALGDWLPYLSVGAKSVNIREKNITRTPDSVTVVKLSANETYPFWGAGVDYRLNRRLAVGVEGQVGYPSIGYSRDSFTTVLSLKYLLSSD